MSEARVVVSKIISKQTSVSEAAAAYGVSRQYIHRWLARYRDHGFDGLEPRSGKPHSNPRRTASKVAERIVALRRELAVQGLDHGPQTIGWRLEQEQLRAVDLDDPSDLVAPGLVTAEPRSGPRAPTGGSKPTNPTECWQPDFTHWQLPDGNVVEIINWLDDHSRYLLCVVARPRITVRTWSPQHSLVSGRSSGHLSRAGRRAMRFNGAAPQRPRVAAEPALRSSPS